MDDEDDILMLLQDDKRLMIMKDPEPQLVAVAKVSFTLNNMTRRRPPVDKRMPR